MMHDIVEVIDMLKDLMAAMPSGAERDQLEGRLDRTCERLERMPERIAARAPFKTAAEAEAVLTEECLYVAAALDG